jgi:hypothetical protein
MRLNRRDTKTQASMKPLESSRPQRRNSIARKTTASRRQVNIAARRRTLCLTLMSSYGLIFGQKRESKRIKSEFCKKRSSETAR